MTTVLTARSSGASTPSNGRHSYNRHPRKSRFWIPALLQVVAMTGIAALVFPAAANWFAELHHDAEISGYTETVAAMPTAQMEAVRQAAAHYNTDLPTGVLHDPYGEVDLSVADYTKSEEYRAYQGVLDLTAGGPLAELNYPRLAIDLPVYHGTSDEVLSRGVGHLYGSSLPIGGPSTHAVLTSHSGLLGASLFTHLTDARIGDVFQINVLGQTLFYQVDAIETVLPENTKDLAIIEGQDHVTLITCTPIGVNSHRLLVRGVRIDAPDTAGSSPIAGDGQSVGFPWWALIFVGGSLVTAYLLFAPTKPRRQSSSGEGQVNA